MRRILMHETNLRGHSKTTERSKIDIEDSDVLEDYNPI